VFNYFLSLYPRDLVSFFRKKNEIPASTTAPLVPVTTMLPTPEDAMGAVNGQVRKVEIELYGNAVEHWLKNIYEPYLYNYFKGLYPSADDVTTTPMTKQQMVNAFKSFHKILVGNTEMEVLSLAMEEMEEMVKESTTEAPGPGAKQTTGLIESQKAYNKVYTEARRELAERNRLWKERMGN
jgi:hypothetical protein